MKLSSYDVTSCNDFGDRFCFIRKGRIGGGGWVHPKSADGMAVSGLHFNALVGSGWATAVLLCMNGLRKQSSRSAWHPFLAGQSGRVVAS